MRCVSPANHRYSLALLMLPLAFLSIIKTLQQGELKMRIVQNFFRVVIVFFLLFMVKTFMPMPTASLAMPKSAVQANVLPAVNAVAFRPPLLQAATPTTTVTISDTATPQVTDTPTVASTATTTETAATDTPTPLPTETVSSTATVEAP